MTGIFKRVFGAAKPVIGMVHLGALPGSPLYDRERGLAGLVDAAAKDLAAIDTADGAPRPMTSIERCAFYQRAKQAYCVIQTGERRFYGCFDFRKGVIPPDAD